jgi:hypothetical protein
MINIEHSFHVVENGPWGDFSLFCLDSMRSTISAKSSQLCGDKVSLTWGDFSLFCLDSMRSTISAKSSQLCGDKVSLSDRPWMSSYIMQCVSWLWTVYRVLTLVWLLSWRVELDIVVSPNLANQNKSCRCGDVLTRTQSKRPKRKQASWLCLGREAGCSTILASFHPVTGAVSCSRFVPVKLHA